MPLMMPAAIAHVAAAVQLAKLALAVAMWAANRAFPGAWPKRAMWTWRTACWAVVSMANIVAQKPALAYRFVCGAVS